MPSKKESFVKCPVPNCRAKLYQSEIEGHVRTVHLTQRIDKSGVDQDKQKKILDRRNQPKKLYDVPIKTEKLVKIEDHTKSKDRRSFNVGDRFSDRDLTTSTNRQDVKIEQRDQVSDEETDYIDRVGTNNSAETQQRPCEMLDNLSGILNDIEVSLLGAMPDDPISAIHLGCRVKAQALVAEIRKKDDVIENQAKQIQRKESIITGQEALIQDLTSTIDDQVEKMKEMSKELAELRRFKNSGRFDRNEEEIEHPIRASDVIRTADPIVAVVRGYKFTLFKSQIDKILEEESKTPTKMARNLIKAVLDKPTEWWANASTGNQQGKNIVSQKAIDCVLEFVKNKQAENSHKDGWKQYKSWSFMEEDCKKSIRGVIDDAVRKMKPPTPKSQRSSATRGSRQKVITTTVEVHANKRDKSSSNETISRKSGKFFGMFSRKK